MGDVPDLEHLVDLVTELRKLPNETGWVEFKVNNSNPADIGQYISALSNSAVLSDRTSAYVIWGLVLGKALRHDVPMYPEIAIRELIANALIHQDFAISGSGPMVEIFEDRMEITSPGLPLTDTQRCKRSPTLAGW